MKRLTNFVIVFGLLTSVVFAQFKPEYQEFPTHKANFFSTLETDAQTFWNVGSDLFTSPFKFDSEDWLLTGIISGSFLLSNSLDNTFRSAIRSNRSVQMDNITMFGERMGNPQYGTILSGLLYIGGHITGDKEIRETGQMLAEAILFNGIITTGMKMTFNRARPYTQEGSAGYEFFEFEMEDNEMSFPSGHTSTAFTIATVLSERIDNIYASIALYSLASLTAYQRMYDDKHWFSDTLLGAALGTVIGMKIVKLHSEYNKNEEALRLRISPSVSQSSYEVNLQLNF